MPPKSQQDGHAQHERPGAAGAPVLQPAHAAHAHSKLSAARAAVREFLASELKAREVRVTKIAPLGHRDGWRAEALILVPNLEVKMLGLPLTQEVLEQDFYAVELDADMIVTSFQQLTEEEK